MEVFKQVINFGDVKISPVGLFFIFTAIMIGVFKQYWLIAGVNTTSKKELEKIDLEYLGKYMGIFLGIFGLSLTISPFVFRYFNIFEYYRYFMVFAPFIFVAFLFIYSYLKKDKIYKKE